MKASELDYPADVPVEAGREIIRMVRDGTIRQDGDRFAKHAWIFQGFLQRMIVGEKLPTLSEQFADDQQMCQDLEYLLDGTGQFISLPGLLRWLLIKIKDDALSS